ncbi:MAG: SOS response-associated peptidase [Firmicutes bacterium HGW-Firmicutes-11]|jgi:putative SOS response-associated peptidase YedK|nr:MAG: SOS response-associated peptidase [Firmicutes bacterium HGW-Firmicutes-11]
MCGRYAYFNDIELKEIVRIAEGSVSEPEISEARMMEIRPTEVAPILVAEKGIVLPKLVSWGFPGFHGSEVIFNARSETAQEKPMFRTALAGGRCVVPSVGFYEWDKEKRKHLLRLSDSSFLFMAGLFRFFKGVPKFVILTTAANETMSHIHDRMPLVLPSSELHDWLNDESSALKYLSSSGLPLVSQIVDVSKDPKSGQLSFL